MLRKAFVLLALAAFSGLLGFAAPLSEVAGAALTGAAQVLFVIFLALLLVSLVAGLVAQAEADRAPEDARD